MKGFHLIVRKQILFPLKLVKPPPTGWIPDERVDRGRPKYHQEACWVSGGLGGCTQTEQVTLPSSPASWAPEYTP